MDKIEMKSIKSVLCKEVVMYSCYNSYLSTYFICKNGMPNLPTSAEATLKI